MDNIKIKAGPIRHLTDARYFAAFGVDWLSFSFDPTSPDYISPDIALQIKNWLAGPRIVGQFAEQDLENVKEISNFLGLHAIQLKVEQFIALETAFGSSWLEQFETCFIEIAYGEQLPAHLAANEQLKFELAGSALHIESILNGEDEFKQHYAEIASRLTLDFPFSTTNLIELLASVKPYAINVSGGNEEKTGMKDYESLNELLELLVYDS